MLNPRTPERERIAKRIARELRDGDVVNLGIGIPSMIMDFAGDKKVFFQSENGILGVGPTPPEEEADYDLVGASRNPVTLTPGASLFDSCASFAMIRGGHIDLAVLGALEVDETGEIANWAAPGASILGVGGSMDLVAGARRIIVAMLHQAKNGKPKLVRHLNCPTSGVKRADMVVTEKAVFVVRDRKLILAEIDPGITVDELRAVTEANFDVSPRLAPYTN